MFFNSLDRFPLQKHGGCKLLTNKDADRRKVVAESPGRKVGYARVSTDEQSLALQIDALEAEGCALVFQDVASGVKADRKGFAAAVAACQPGDVLTAWKLDRLGRSLFDLVSLAEVLKARDVGLKLLTGAGAAIDTTTAQGKLMFAVMAGFAEFERELIRERTTAGIKAARNRGKRMGRPLKLSHDRLDAAAQLRAVGRPWREVATVLGVSTSTLRDGLNHRKADIEARLMRQKSTPLESYLAALGGG